MKTIASSNILGLAMIFTISANATSTGTITFNGSITGVTCEVAVDGGSADAIVQLPSVAINELSSLGNTTGRTTFNLGVSNCELGTDVAPSVAAYFQPGATVDSATGRLMQTAVAGAENVSLQLRDGTNNSVIFAGDSSQITSAAWKKLENGVSLTLPYSIEYYAEGPTTAGPVTSSVVYNLQYK